MKILFDFFPALVFFLAYKYYDIYVATFTLMVMTYIQIFLMWFKDKEIENTYKLMAVLITLFGGLTLLLHNELFIKWKPTVINWMFGFIFLGSHWIGEKTVLERLLDQKVELPKAIWKKLNFMWIGFFFSMGLLNIYVAYQYTTDVWVNFKVFGVLGFTIVFSVLQGLYLAQYIEE
jgi:intracellular septation protein